MPGHWITAIFSLPSSLMDPSTEPVRRTSSVQGGQIVLAVALGVTAALLLGVLIVSIILFRRRRRAATQYHPSPAERARQARKANLSDASVDPLLTKAIRNEGALREKASLPTLRSADEITPYNRNSLSINTTGLYRLPSAETFSPTAAFPPAAPSSFCLPHSPDARSLNDQQHHPPSMQRPALPPLVIPSGQSTNSYSNAPALVEEPSSPSRPPSRCPSSSSLYSQPTAESPPTPHPATYLHLPLSQELTYETAPEETGLQRGDTHLVGNLLKARAQRNPAGLVRASSQVSHIERMGSIRSVGPLHEDERPFARRYRSKKRKVRRDGGMEVVNEVLPEDASLRGLSTSSASHYVTTPLIKPPSPVISFLQSPSLRKP